MRGHVLSVSLFVVFAVSVAFPQAAAEAALLNGNSATATAKAGTVLGNTLNKASSKVGGQIQTITQPKAANQPRKPVTRSTVPLHAAPSTKSSGGSMIISIQGGTVTRSSNNSTSTAQPSN